MTEISQHLKDALAAFSLPSSIVGRPSAAKILREVEAIDVAMENASIREPGKAPVLPSVSRGLADTLEQNKWDIMDASRRTELVQILRLIKDKSPVMYITFASDPEVDILDGFVVWIRGNLHQRALIQVGVQPGIVGGCVVRTPSHIYDMSLKHFLVEKRPYLQERLRSLLAS